MQAQPGDSDGPVSLVAWTESASKEDSLEQITAYTHEATKMEMSVHEAGHIVASFVVTGHPEIIRDAGVRWFLVDWQGLTRSQENLYTGYTRSLMSWAGPWAAFRYAYPQHSDKPSGEILPHFDLFAGSDARFFRKKRYKADLDEARAIVSKHWRSILAVAAILEREDRISGADAYKIYRDPPRKLLELAPTLTVAQEDCDEE